MSKLLLSFKLPFLVFYNQFWDLTYSLFTYFSTLDSYFEILLSILHGSWNLDVKLNREGRLEQFYLFVDSVGLSSVKFPVGV